MNAVRRMPKLENAACISVKPTNTLCQTCWDRPECLAWALEYERDGFWAGYKAIDRVRMRKQFDIPLRTIGEGT